MKYGVGRAFRTSHATRTWPFLTTGFAMGLAVLLSAYYVYHDFPHKMPNATLLLMATLLCALPPQLIGLLYNAGVTESLSCHLPESTLLLPVSSFSIVLHRFIFNLTVMIGTTGVLSLLCSGLAGGLDPAWWHWLALTAGLISLLQFVAVAASPTGDWAVGFLAAAALVYFILFGRNMNAPTPWTATLFNFGVTVASFLATWANVHLIRRGIWEFPSTRTRASFWTRRDPKPFRSAQQAQLWLESASYRRFVLRTFFVFMPIGIFLGLFGDADFLNEWWRIYDGHKWFVTLGYLAFCFVAAALLGGAIISIQHRRWQAGSMAAFLYLRPMTTSTLAAARLNAAIRTIVAPALAILVALILDAYVNSEPRPYLYGPVTALQRGTYQPILFDFVVKYYVGLMPLIAYAWCALWTWNLFVAAALTISSAGALFVTRLNESIHADAYLGDTMVSAIFAASIISIALAVKRRVIDFKSLIGVIGLTSVGFGVWAYLAVPRPHLMVAYFDVRLEYELRNLLALFAIAISPLGTVPLALHWTRHR